MSEQKKKAVAESMLLSSTVTTTPLSGTRKRLYTVARTSSGTSRDLTVPMAGQ